MYSWLRYCLKGGRDKIVLADLSLDGFTGHDNQFDENNTQWYLYVNPDEVIQPTYYIVA
jgi:hypothetical protein